MESETSVVTFTAPEKSRALEPGKTEPKNLAKHSSTCIK